MNTPALSEAASPRPAAPTHPALPREPRTRPARPSALPRPLAGPARRPPGANPSSAGEVAAGVLLLVVWTLLWSFFLMAVVEPGAALRRAAEAPAPRSQLARRTAGLLAAPSAGPRSP